jgi:hypothetical protein
LEERESQKPQKENKEYHQYSEKQVVVVLIRKIQIASLQISPQKKEKLNRKSRKKIERENVLKH